MTPAAEWVVITGLSGSGKTLASQHFEDMGYFCVDNMPVGLLPAFEKLALASHADLPRVALVVDVRERSFLKDFPKVYKALLEDSHLKSTLIFLECDTSVLLKRFSESRRRHPLNAQGGDAPALDLRDAIEEERRLLLPVRELADIVIDTTALPAARLKAMLREKLPAGSRAGEMRVAVTSFGFKHGIPSDASLVLDVRFLPNPHYDDALRPLDGLNPLVRGFVEKTPEYGEFLRRAVDLLAYLVPKYREEGKAYLGIAVGCTGGRHRSVVVADALAAAVAKMGFTPHVEHRDKDRE
jgi:RNase adapter protein RapZ